MVGAMETQSFEILDETRCGGYGLLMGVRFGLLVTALGAVGFVIGKEISKKGLTTLSGLVMVPTWLRQNPQTQIPSPSSTSLCEVI